MELRLAVTPLARLRGLLGRPQPAAPLLLAPVRSVHTFGLRGPIDVVFLDAGLRVVKVRARLAPWRIAGARGAVAVLELPPGAADVRPGERFELRRGS